MTAGDLKTRTQSEAGMTLVEVLVALAILGIAVITIVGGLGTASNASDRHRKQATADTVVKGYAEAIKQKDEVGAYVGCTTATPTPLSSYAPTSLHSGWTVPSGYTASATAIKYWNPTAVAFQSSCPSGNDQGAQLLTLSAQSADGRDTETVDIVLRKP
jgi:prepilin-type N-terminal cleavage/methylation domain-containing protein